MQTLTPVDGRKSFYGKCEMIEDREIIKLSSYGTIVADYNADTGKMTVHGWYSMTTARHINAFLNHFGFPTSCKKEMMDWDNK